MVPRYLARRRVRDLLLPRPPDDRPPEGPAHLRRQLVLHGIHPGRRGPAHRQQPRRSGLSRARQELHRMARGPGRDGAVVVRPQRGGVLPDRRLPRDAGLLSADAGATTALFLPAVPPDLMEPPVLLPAGGVDPTAITSPA